MFIGKGEPLQLLLRRKVKEVEGFLVHVYDAILFPFEEVFFSIVQLLQFDLYLKVEEINFYKLVRR